MADRQDTGRPAFGVATSRATERRRRVRPRRREADRVAGEFLSERVFSRLKDLVLSNHLRPGERLQDRDLARLLAVSRTPVREALARLHQDGLLETRDGRGYFVVDVQDPRHIGDLYALRELLEVHAVHLAAERARPEDLDELAELLASLDALRDDPRRRGDEIKLGLRVHEIIARASGNSFLHETLTRLLNRMRFFIWIETIYEEGEEVDTTRREHAAFLALLREHKGAEAEVVMRAHLRTARDHILRIAQLKEAFYAPADLSPIGLGDGRGRSRSAGAARRGKGSRPRARRAAPTAG